MTEAPWCACLCLLLKRYKLKVGAFHTFSLEKEKEQNKLEVIGLKTLQLFSQCLNRLAFAIAVLIELFLLGLCGTNTHIAVKPNLWALVLPSELCPGIGLLFSSPPLLSSPPLSSSALGVAETRALLDSILALDRPFEFW